MCGYRRVTRMRIVHALLIALSVLPLGCSSPGSRYDPNPQVYGLGDVVPEGGGRYKVGDPYRAGGEMFYPREDTSYDKTGTASWYGDYFHGRKTANGEWYDMNRMSAAHPTLPLPVYARVTNLQNGRSLVVRVNDRGPFKHDRIIDLSKGAANQLGMVQAGTAPVRVTYLGRAPLEGDVPNMQMVDRGTSWLSPFSTASVDEATTGRQGKTGRRGKTGSWNSGSAAALVATPGEGAGSSWLDGSGLFGSIASLWGDTPPPAPADAARTYPAPVSVPDFAPAPAVQVAPLPLPVASSERLPDGSTGILGTLPAPAETGSLGILPATPQGSYVQVASFADEGRARSLADELAHLGSFTVLPAEVAGSTYYRVRSAPVASVGEAQSIQALIESMGIGGSRIYGR